MCQVYCLSVGVVVGGSGQQAWRSGSKQTDKLAVAVSGKASPLVSTCFPFSVPSKILICTLRLFVFCSFGLDPCSCQFLLSQRLRENVVEWQNNPAWIFLPLWLLELYFHFFHLSITVWANMVSVAKGWTEHHMLCSGLMHLESERRLILADGFFSSVA